MIGNLIQTLDVLTPEEVTKVLELLKDADWQPTTVFGMSGCEVNTDIRSNTRLCLHDTSEAAAIMHSGMNKALLKYREEVIHIHGLFGQFPVPGSFRTDSWREQIQVLKYENTEYYKWHSDQASDVKDNAYHRTFSVVLYLTDDFEGGRTEFPHTSFKPKAGQALIFPSNWCFPHQSQPVTKGTKIVAVTWYHCYYNYTT